MTLSIKILLYYKYVAIEYPKQVQKWQQALCAELNLTGRIIIAHEGINGTVGGSSEALEAYQQAMVEHPLFDGIDFKHSEGAADSFPRMRIVIKDEIVRLGISSEMRDVPTRRAPLDPGEAHESDSQRPEDLLILMVATIMNLVLVLSQVLLPPIYKHSVIFRTISTKI